MATWGELANAAPELAALGRERIEKTYVILLGSIRKDGSPRISPVEPDFVGDELMLGMMWRSKKALDLLRDRRCVVHNAIADKDGTEGEFKIRGRAVPVEDEARRTAYKDTIEARLDWRPEEPFHVFAIEIEDVTFVQYPEGPAAMQRWVAG